jgi:hypothetical protein
MLLPLRGAEHVEERGTAALQPAAVSDQSSHLVHGRKCEEDPGGPWLCTLVNSVHDGDWSPRQKLGDEGDALGDKEVCVGEGGGGGEEELLPVLNAMLVAI